MMVGNQRNESRKHIILYKYITYVISGIGFIIYYISIGICLMNFNKVKFIYPDSHIGLWLYMDVAWYGTMVMMLLIAMKIWTKYQKMESKCLHWRFCRLCLPYKSYIAHNRHIHSRHLLFHSRLHSLKSVALLYGIYFIFKYIPYRCRDMNQKFMNMDGPKGRSKTLTWCKDFSGLDAFFATHHI